MTVRRTRAGPGAWPLSGWEPRSLVFETWVVMAPASISIVSISAACFCPLGWGWGAMSEHSEDEWLGQV